MKFWQKAYICIIVIFLIGFDITVFLLINKSYSLSMQEKYSTAENERHVIQASLQSRISGASALYREINAKNLKMYIAPYGDYYANQNIYMELYYGDDIVYSDFPYTMGARPELDIGQGEKSTIAREVDGALYYFVTGYLEEPYSNIKFVYIKNVQDLADYKAQMIRHAVIIGVVISILLSILLLFLLLRLTRPIRKLNQITEEIAGGNYQKRAQINGKDEIGEFAGNFNAMADSVQAHIQKLSDVTEERQRFIDNLAHEMSTPITAIMGFGEFLKYANYTPEEGVKAIDYIIHQSERMKSMAHKLMDLARLNNTEIAPQTIDLRDMLAYVESTLEQNIKGKHVQVEKDLQVFLIVGDKDLIESLLLNIMENALRALPDGGKIEVKTRREGDGFILSIADNGTGIAQGDIPKVFEPFYRADKSRSRAYGGAGLGLSLCKQICDLHYARMEISSQPDIGTTIAIKFSKFTILPQLRDDSEITKPYDNSASS
ncbi:Signal transduction histidine kinase [Sporobacter termitidis DSM 10068]|uniref:histidine kinase n=1 Tax=Sporobacter termitidis DSM 10068 TaxID=1123282 RepID=A0A1M5W5R2_9FIRM|nr:HAMP domain-containing sensor histidine kinase [Sporobacter termitidis]SHH82805.1 Signal transduction histidine kinase [Sporobacter termitidis DSM 10068]